MQATDGGPNPHYEGTFDGEREDLANLRRTLAAENADLQSRLSAAERERDEAKADRDEEEAVRERCAQLLAQTAIALKGPEKALQRHGWQDLPELAAKLIEHRDALLIDLAASLEREDQAIAYGEKLKEAMQNIWDSDVVGNTPGRYLAGRALSITAPAALSHLRQEIIERCANACWPDGKVWSETERDAMAAAFKRAEEKGRGFYETLFAVGATVAKANAAAIRRLAEEQEGMNGL